MRIKFKFIKFKFKKKQTLYCCGNCKYRIAAVLHDHTIEKCKKGKVTCSYEYCSEYEFDGVDRILRTIDYAQKYNIPPPPPKKQ